MEEANGSAEDREGEASEELNSTMICDVLAMGWCRGVVVKHAD